MTKPELIREIGIHLKKVVDIYNQLAKNPEAFTPGEIDILVNNATKIIEFSAVVKFQPASITNSDEQVKLRNLEDKLRVLNEQLKNKDLAYEKIQKENKELEKKIEESKLIAHSFNINIPDIEEGTDANSTIAKNDLLNDSFNHSIPLVTSFPFEEEVKNDTIENKKVDFFDLPKENKKEEPINNSFASKYENEHLESNKKTVMHLLNDTIIDGSKENVVDKLMNAKVEDLKKAIPLHEKFMYTNELFGKNNDHYTQFLEALNTKKTWKEAEGLLAQAASMYKWNPENKTALQFIALIQRRFN